MAPTSASRRPARGVGDAVLGLGVGQGARADEVVLAEAFGTVELDLGLGERFLRLVDLWPRATTRVAASVARASS